jgi:apolipoprotein N-acyltransferase
MVAILACGPALVAVVLCLGERRGRAWWWLAPAAWVTVEWMRSQTALGFPWALVGYSQAGVLPVAQLAALTGVFGLSALVVFVNVALANAWAAPAGRRRARWVTVALAVPALVGAAGAARLAQVEPPVPWLRVALVDGSVAQQERAQPDESDAVLGRYAALTEAAATTRPDLVVWPETALPFFLGDPGRRRLRVGVRSPRACGTPRSRTG